jgi:hypothetical protein
MNQPGRVPDVTGTVERNVERDATDWLLNRYLGELGDPGRALTERRRRRDHRRRDHLAQDQTNT